MLIHRSPGAQEWGVVGVNTHLAPLPFFPTTESNTVHDLLEKDFAEP